MRIVLDHTGRFLLALPAVLVVSLLWLLSSQAGSQFVLNRVSAASNGVIQIGTLQREAHLLGDLRVDRIDITTPGALVALENVELRWSPLALLALRAQVDRLAAERIAVTLRERDADPEPETSPGPPLTRLPVSVYLRELAIGSLGITDASGATQYIERITLRADWRGERIRIARLTAESDQYGPLALSARGRLRSDRADLEALALAAPFELTASGHYAYAGTFAGALNWTEARWPLVAETAQVRSAEGRAAIEGAIDDYRATVDADLSTPDYAGRFTLAGHGSAGHITLDPLDIQALDGSATASGTVRWSPALQLDVEAQLRQLDLAAVLPDWPGRISGRITARGGLDADNPLVFAADIADSSLRGYPLALRAEGGWRNETLSITLAELRQGDSRLSASGTAWPQLDLRAQLESPDLAALWPALTGRAQLELSARGEPARPSVAVQGQASNLGWADAATLAQVHLTARFDPNGPVELDLEARDIRAGVSIETLRTRLRGRVQDHRLSVDAQLPQGRLEIGLAGQLDLNKGAWRGALQSATVQAESVPPLTLQGPAMIAVSASQQVLESACWQSPAPAQMSLCVKGRQAGGKTAARIDLTRFDYGLIAAFLPSHWRLQGAVAGHADLQMAAGASPRIDIDLQTEAGGLEIGREAAMSFAPGHIRLQEGDDGLRMDVDLPTSQGGIQITGDLQPAADFASRVVDAQFRARFDDLAWINRLSPEFRDLEGSLNAEVAIGGTVAAPVFDGQVALAVPQIHLVTPGITLKDVAAQLRAEPGVPAVIEATAMSGTGALALNGNINLTASPPEMTLRLTGDQAQVADLADARVWASPDITVELGNQRLDVKGRVDIPRATITPRGFEGGTAPSSDQVIIRADIEQADPLMDVFVNVTVALGDKVSFDGFGLKSRLTGDITARQSPGRAVTGRGEIRLIDGRYKAYGQDLSIDTGRLLFTGGPITDPAIEIRATRQPRDDIEVGVSVRGRLDKPEFALFSTPGMPQDQQLSWLILGRDLSASTTGDDQAALAGAALSLGLSGSDFLAQRLKGGLRIDDISIGAKPGEDPETAKLTIGKYLSPKLYVAYGVGLFQPGHIFRLLYDIGRGFKLQTETGVASGADLLYTIER